MPASLGFRTMAVIHEVSLRLVNDAFGYGRTA